MKITMRRVHDDVNDHTRVWLRNDAGVELELDADVSRIEYLQPNDKIRVTLELHVDTLERLPCEDGPSLADFVDPWPTRFTERK